MKQVFLAAACFFFTAHIFSQTIIGNQQVITVNTGGNPSTSQALLYLPDTYSTDTSHYPLIIFLGGLGEQGSDIHLLLNYGTLPYRISQGFNPGAVNPVDGKMYKFIVFSPQGPAGSWGWQAVPHLRTMLPQIEAQYRVDASRIYVTGLSAGGWGTWSCITDDTTFCKSLAAIAPISSAAAQNPQNIGNAAKYNVPVWSICGDQDSFWPLAKQYTATINALNPVVQAKLTDDVGVGHSAWYQGYDPEWYDANDPKKLNLYEWLLQYTRFGKTPISNKGGLTASGLPVANAGTDITIILPANTTTLNGSKSYDSSSSILSYQWSAISGPSTPIFGSVSGITTSVSGLIKGVYKFQLTVIDSNNRTASDTVSVNVSGSGPVAKAGNDITLQLPVDFTILNGSSSYDLTGTIVKYQWTKIVGAGEFAIANNDSATAIASNLSAGIYLIKLTVTDDQGLTSGDTLQVTVLDSSSNTKCKGKKIYITKGSNNGYYINGPAFSYNPGDTIVLKASQNPFSYFSLESVHGTASCPVTIINEGGQVSLSNGFAFSNCTFINLVGTGSSDYYGFHIEDTASQGVAIDISGRSGNVSVSNIYIHNKTYGFWVKQEGSCIDSLQYPNWVIDNIILHDNKITKTTQEGMYLGSTDPNGTRPVSCNGITIYPKPLRLGDIKVYNNIIDSTYRSGIQLSCAQFGRNHIFNNTISNAGFELNSSQGNGISLGGYSHAYVHDNTITNTYAVGILCLGAGHVRIENNNVSNSGQLAGYVINGMANILVDTRSTNPIDSSLLDVENNNLANNTDYNIRFYSTYKTYKNGNIICHNTGTMHVAEGIDWTNCANTSKVAAPLLAAAPAARLKTLLPYPNPAKDVLHVQLGNIILGKTNITIIDQQGRVLTNNTFTNEISNTTQDVDISKLSPGLYFLQVINKKERTIFKFEKM